MSVMLEHGLRRGELVRVTEQDLPSGLACDCVCPECGGSLIAKRGEVLAFHFAHYGVSEDSHGRLSNGCSGGKESAAHLLAKQIIEEERRLRFPKEESLIEVDGVALEVTVEGQIRPDIVVTRGSKRALVEIFVTSRCSEAKRLFLLQNKMPSLEINLSAWREKSLHDGGFRAAVLTRASRYWIYDPTRPEVGEMLIERLRLAKEDREKRDLRLLFSKTTSAKEHLDLVDRSEIRALIDEARETPQWATIHEVIRDNYARFYAWPRMPEAALAELLAKVGRK